MSKKTEYIEIPARTAWLIRRVFLPTNPNKMRNADPEVVQAAKDFIARVESPESLAKISRTAPPPVPEGGQEGK